jgi:hypothetical protein
MKRFKTLKSYTLYTLLANVFNRKYVVFRRYAHIEGEVKEQFAQHFVYSFTSIKTAKKEIENAKIIEPWQEFVILNVC